MVESYNRNMISNSLFPIKNKNKWGYINKSGQLIIEP